METVYQLGQATVAEVLKLLPDPPSYSSVRKMLGVLEEKGHLAHRHDKNRYVYYPTVARRKAQSSALKHLVKTFFENSPAQAMSALLDSAAGRMSKQELDELRALIDKARKQGR